MTNHEVCPTCPFLAACEVAREIANTNGHKDPETVLGGLALSEQALLGVVKRAGCPEPQINTHGQQVCPNENAATTARLLGATKWPIQSYELSLAALAGVEQQNPIGGQYL